MKDGSSQIFVWFELTRPWMLATLALLGVIVWYYRFSLSDFPKAQRRISLYARILVLICLSLALAGLQYLQPTQRKYVILAVDRSPSIGERASQNAYQFAIQLKEHAGPADIVSVVEFDRRSTGLSPLEGWLSGRGSQTGSSDQSRSNPASSASAAAMATNIADAIQTASAALPPDYVPQIVLLTDGRQTDGDALHAARQAVTSVGPIPISTLVLPIGEGPEIQIADITCPTQVKLGEPFFVEVTVSSNRDGQGFVDLYRGDILATEQKSPIAIGKGETKLRFRQIVEEETQTTFVARIRGFEDTLAENNSASAVVYASGKPSVLIVDSQVDQVNELRMALEEQGSLVQTRPLEGIPRTLPELQQFDCLVLSNVPATAMSLQQMELVRTYVQELGGGLMVLGGDQSFGLGGYYKTTLEELLPVRSNFDKEKPSLAMVLAIDKSGSMGGQKIELAKDAAKGSVELLADRDQLGVIAFDGNSYWISEIHSAADKGYIAERISTVEASGGTNIYPALKDAYDALSNTSAKIKHVILMTDGHSEPGDFQGVVRDMVAARITLSSVAVGSEADTNLLEQLAQIGGGRYYACDDAQNVPQIFAKETMTASQSAINELPFLPLMIRPTPVLAGIDFESAPFLLGYVVTQPKPTAELILATESGDPLLAWWRYGLGVTVAFTSDAKSQWGSEWIAWPQFGQFWSQVLRHAMRRHDERGLFVDIKRTGTEGQIVVDALDENGQFINEAPSTITVVDPKLQRQTVQLNQTAPGRYEASFPAETQGAYSLEIRQVRGNSNDLQQSRGFVVGYPEELRFGPANESLLKQIAEVSGGLINPSPEEVFQHSPRGSWIPIPLWPYLLAVAIVLWIIDVAFRRLDLSITLRK